MLAFALMMITLAAAPPSIEDAAARHGPALVAVHAPGAAPTGFFVASSGVAVVLVREDTTSVILELASGERRQARVRVRDADGLALVEVQRLPKDALFPALALSPRPTVPAASAWLLGIGTVEGRASPSLGGLRRVDAQGRWRLDLPLDAGAPIFNGDKVTAIVVERHGTTSCSAIPVDRISALVRRL